MIKVGAPSGAAKCARVRSELAFADGVRVGRKRVVRLMPPPGARDAPPPGRVDPPRTARRADPLVPRRITPVQPDATWTATSRRSPR
jgi:hypothetical protein